MGWKGKGNNIWQGEAEPYIIPRPLNCLITTAKFILLNYYSYKLIKCLLHIWEKQKVIIPPKTMATSNKRYMYPHPHTGDQP